jgi:hypothetical protein
MKPSDPRQSDRQQGRSTQEWKLHLTSRLFKATALFDQCLRYAIPAALIVTAVAGILSRGAWLTWISFGLLVMKAGTAAALLVMVWSLWFDRSGRGIVRERSRHLSSVAEWMALKTSEQLNLAGILLALIPVHISIGISFGFLVLFLLGSYL